LDGRTYKAGLVFCSTLEWNASKKWGAYTNLGEPHGSENNLEGKERMEWGKIRQNNGEE